MGYCTYRNTELTAKELDRMTTFASLCSGAAMLDMGIESVLGPLTHLWYAENDKAASAVMAHHYPGVPNFGDITAVDWTTLARPAVMAAGYPCTDVSHAGRRLGLREGTRTGIWSHIAVGISVLRPQLVLLENVEGHHSASAASDMEPCPWCVGDNPDRTVLRASGAVLGDLADLGYDARWVTVPASDIGAPHRRKRAFFVAYPADTESLGHWIAGAQGGQGVSAAAVGGAVRTDVTLLPTPVAGAFNEAEDLDSWNARRAECAERHGNNGFGVPLGVAVRMLPTPAARDYKGHGPADMNRNSPNLSAIEGLLPSVDLGVGPTLLPTPRSTDGTGSGTHGTGGLDLRTAVSLLPTPRATDGTKDGPNQRGSSGDLMLPSAVMLLPTPTGTHWARNATADRTDPKPGTNANGWTLAGIAHAARWGEYGPAIARWEAALGRPAPDPTETGTKGQQRLSPRFVEWMLGLPAGWVCDVPGITRNDQLRILGNGVVPAQAAYAYRYLLSI